MSRLSDKLLEVELFVGEQLQDYTHDISQKNRHGTTYPGTSGIGEHKY